MMAKPKFKPFPVPIKTTDTPLVQHAGVDYTCTGCGEHVPAGLHIHETINDGMVIGLRMIAGADGPVVHQCGEVG
jgi:hypothetical protein